MDCSCEIECELDYEDAPSAILRHKTTKARKTHKCHECKGDILPGENYMDISYVFEGKIERYKSCADCEKTADALFKNGHMYGAIWAYIDANLYEVDCGMPEDCVAALPVKSREKLCDLIDECNKYMLDRAWEEGDDEDDSD